jgi:hypothetical protein
MQVTLSSDLLFVILYYAGKKHLLFKQVVCWSPLSDQPSAAGKDNGAGYFGIHYGSVVVDAYNV